MWNPGLVVIGGDSCSEGCGFKSHRHILDGHFSQLFVARIVFEKTKLNEKEAHFLNKKTCGTLFWVRAGKN